MRRPRCSQRGGSGSSRMQSSPRSTALTAVLLVLLLGSSVHANPRHIAAGRKLLQVTATSATPVNINAGTAPMVTPAAAADFQPTVISTSGPSDSTAASAAPAVRSQAVAAAAGSEPQVTASGGAAFDKFKSIASDALSGLFHKGKKGEAVPAAAPVATIVVPPQQVAAVPTTTSGISLKTDTPVTLASPINVTTPVKQKNVQVDAGGEDLLNTLINLGNLGANSAAAGGAIAGAVAGFLDTFLPDCPPPIEGAPPIPGCQLIDGINGLVNGGGAPLSATVVNVNSPGAVGADIDKALAVSNAAGSGGNRPGPPGGPGKGDKDDKRSTTAQATPQPAAAKSSEPLSPIRVFQGIMGWP